MACCGQVTVIRPPIDMASQSDVLKVIVSSKKLIMTYFTLETIIIHRTARLF